MAIHIGTSGWHYRHWQGVYYPPGLAADDWLAYYAKDFGCVELNSSFYHLPDSATINDWTNATPGDFRFAAKASRYISHQKKLRDCKEPLQRLLRGLEPFEQKLGPLLFQLPPHWRMNLERLEEFTSLLPDDLQVAMEFRDTSWHCQPVWELLRERQIAWCEFDLPDVECTPQLTAPFTYLRLHGPGPRPYCGSYQESRLRILARRLLQLEDQGIDCWVFFDNDEDGHAVDNAMQLNSFCGTEKAGGP